ncbi:Mlo-related protein, partial [Dioscorea alata]
AGSERKVDQTPTWAVALVCAVFILISIFLEKWTSSHWTWLTDNNKKPVFEAHERIKSELMILGFISLLSSFGMNYISKICIPEKAANGKVVLVSSEALHQIHIFIFFLAFFHVFHCAVTMSLGRAKIRKWKEWEKETTSTNYEFSSDPLRFRFAQDTSFMKQHFSFWNRIPILFYIVIFFRQFFWSFQKADYLANVTWFPHEWQALFWVTVVPLIIILAVRTKLQNIITKMAIEIQDSHSVVQGIPLMHLSDKHFWFSRRRLILFLLHFTLFQNGFQIIYFLWIWYEFGLHPCFNENFKLVIARLCFGYVTLPLYELMGSQMKNTIFDAQAAKTLMKWRQTARKKHANVTSLNPSSHPLHRYKTTGHSGQS